MSPSIHSPRRRRSDVADGEPWGHAARAERRLQAAQAAILIGLALIVATVAIVTGRGMVHELAGLRQEQRAQSSLQTLRYELQEQETAFWRRRAAGAPGMTPELILTIGQVSADTRTLADRERGSDPSPEEQHAIDDALVGLDRLIALAPTALSAGPIGSPGDRAFLAKLTAISNELKAAATAWSEANAVELRSANARVEDATRRLTLFTGGTAAVATLLGLIAWMLVSRSRRRLVGALQHAATLLRHQADTDPLTGLANHRVLHDRARAAAERAVASGEALSVVILDLDHFKRVNDTYGHPVGDLVLIETARRVRASARAQDMAARIGGEEFVLLLHDTDGDEAMRIAERLRAAISAADFPGGVGRVTASLGVASLRPGLDADTLLARADAALYAAKGRGRDAVVREDEVPGMARPGTPLTGRRGFGGRVASGGRLPGWGGSAPTVGRRGRKDQ